MLMNIYHDVTVNAARAEASQVDSAVKQFVTSFTTAVNPQITKSYAQGDLPYMHSLVCRSSKFSAFLMLFAAAPILVEAKRPCAGWCRTGRRTASGRHRGNRSRGARSRCC